MIFIQLLVFINIFLLGFVFVSSLTSKIPLIQKTGLALPVGFGISTLIMVIMNFMNIKISITALSIIELIISITLVVFVIRLENFVNLFRISFKDMSRFKRINLSWLLIFALLAYIIYGITTKALFWPPAAYDTITGYDQMAKVVANEGFFNNSIFDPMFSVSSIRHSYPPYTSGSYAIAYMLGFKSSKITLVLIILSFVVLFWSLLYHYTNHTIAILFTLLLFTTPEFLAMSALSLTNVPQTIFASIGLIYLNEYIRKKEMNYLYLASVLIAFNVWTRLDGVVFIAGGGIMLLIDFIQKKSFKNWKNYVPIVVYGIIAIFPIILWEAFKALKIGNVYVEGDAFRKELFFDPDKLSILFKAVWSIIKSKQIFGLTFTILIIVLILNIRNIRKNNGVLLVGIFATFLFYFFLYYQMDTDSNKFGYSIVSMVNASFKRGMFPFLPLVCYYMATSVFITKLFNILMKPTHK